MTEPARKKFPGKDADREPYLSIVPSANIDAGGTESGNYERQIAQLHRSLLSLMELSQELAVSLNPFKIADLVLFNLMGEMGTSKASLWIVSTEGEKRLVHLRSYGIRKQSAHLIGKLFESQKTWNFFVNQTEPVLSENLPAILDIESLNQITEARIGLLGPIRIRDGLQGIIALGKRIGGRPYGVTELRVLQSALGMLGVALENSRLYNSLLEKHRHLRQANESLNELDHLKSEFIHNVNHELRTPLTVIIAYLDNILEEEKEVGRRKEFLEIIMGETKKLDNLLVKLLDFSALAQDSLEIRWENGNILELLRGFHQERMPGLAKGLRDFEFHCGDNLPDVRYDGIRVHQILDALLDNAVKFTPQGSRITLSTKGAMEEKVRWVQLDLEDDGPGIPPDRFSDLFESFRQVDGSSQREVGGMGIGLALAKRLADSMGCKLTVRSTVGKGSTFTLLIPGC